MGRLATVRPTQILDAMLAELGAAYLTPANTQVSEQKYLRALEAYAGQLFNGETVQSNYAIAGRTPAMIVAFGGERRIKTTIGRRTDKVEGTFIVACVSDSMRSVKDRRGALDMVNDARKVLGGRSLGLRVIQRLLAGPTNAVLETPKLLIYSIAFTSRYFVDLTLPGPFDQLMAWSGSIVEGKHGLPAIPTAPTVQIIGGDGAANVSYQIVAVDELGRRSPVSPVGASSIAPAGLTADNFARITWTATPGAALYDVYRVAPSGPIGKLATTSLLTLDDTGLHADGTSPQDPALVSLQRTLS